MKPTTGDYLETIHNAAWDIRSAECSRGLSLDDATACQLVLRAVRDIQRAAEGLAIVEWRTHAGQRFGGWKGSVLRQRDARGRFVSREQAERDVWASDRELERDARRAGVR